MTKCIWIHKRFNLSRVFQKKLKKQLEGIIGYEKKMVKFLEENISKSENEILKEQNKTLRLIWKNIASLEMAQQYTNITKENYRILQEKNKNISAELKHRKVFIKSSRVDLCEEIPRKKSWQKKTTKAKTVCQRKVCLQ